MKKFATRGGAVAVMLAAVFLLQSLFFMPLPAAALDSNVKAVFLNQQNGSDTNSGTTASSAYKTLDTAIKALASQGGTIVITGKYTLSSDYREPSHSSAITFTSVYGGVDYRNSGAGLIFSGKLVYNMSGEDIFRDINIIYNGTCVIAACFNPVTVDTGVVTTKSGSSSQLFLIGGYEAPEANLPDGLDSSITVKSGAFYCVAGFDRTKGKGGTYYHSGTAYINVSGGTIETLLGANLYNHWAKSAVITVSGGTVNKIMTGGDVTRRIESVSVYLYGGTIGAVDVNNVTGNAYIHLYGATIKGSVAVRYQEAFLAQYAEEEGGKKHLAYNGLIYTAVKIAYFSQTFDTTENVSVLYVTDGATGNGFSLETPAGSFTDAMNTLSVNGGCLTVVNRVSVPASFTEREHSEKITIAGTGAAPELVFGNNAVYTASGETVFDGLTFSHSGNLTIKSRHKLTFTRTLHTGPGGVIAEGTEINLYGGSFDKVTGSSVTVGGAVISSLYSTENRDLATALVDIASGTVESLISAENGKITGSFVLRMGGGTLSSLALNNISGGIILNISGGALGTLGTSGCEETDQKRIIYYGKGFSEAAFASVSSLFDEIRGNETIYVADNGTGDGKSPASPTGNLTDAVKALPEGGTVVIIKPVTVASLTSLPLWNGLITITSSFAGTDYRASGASLIMDNSLVCGGNTAFENIKIAAGADCGIYGFGFDLTMDTGIETYLIKGNTTYPSILGGSRGADWITSARVIVNSGTWNRLRAGGSSANASLVACNYSVTINGGTFYGYICAAGDGNISGDTKLTINGGTFYQSIYLLQASNNGGFSGNAVITLNGGIFYGKIAASNSKANTLRGTYSLYISGGDFSHVTDISGAEDFTGTMKSYFYYDEGIDINAAATGTYSFSNYLRVGADPWLFTDGKYYYLTVTAGTRLSLMKAANIGDLAYTEPMPIFAPASGKPYSLNLWSPEIHYFPADVIGKEYAGWYLYFCANRGTSETRRMFVLKCLTDDLQGPWGNPITGEVDVPEYIVGKDDNEINTFMGGGMSPFVYKGELYTTWIGDEGRGTPDYYQVLFINRMENPWTLSGKRVELTRSEYEWEMHGYGQDSISGGWYPKVIEGVSAVIDNDGNLYLMYTGSGYWTIYYALGQMKHLGGDLCDGANWVKLSKTPIFSKSSEINGCGHGSYFKDSEGQGWIAYHAYTGGTTDSGRFVFAEPYIMTENGMVIGNGSTHPAPIDTVYTLNVNSASIADKLSGFESAGTISPEQSEEETTAGKETATDTGASLRPVIIISATAIIAAGITAAIMMTNTKKKKFSE